MVTRMLKRVTRYKKGNNLRKEFLAFLLKPVTMDKKGNISDFISETLKVPVTIYEKGYKCGAVKISQP